MSDLDDDFMQMSEDEDDFSFEYEDEDEEEMLQQDLDGGDDLLDDANEDDDDGHESAANLKSKDIESLYYTAKMLKEDNVSDAIVKFQKIIKIFQDHYVDDFTQPQLEYFFKCVKQLLKLLYHCNEFDSLIKSLPIFFQILPNLENKSYAEDSISKMVNHFDTPKSNLEFLSSFLDRTIEGVVESFGLAELPNGRTIPQDRLWMIVNLKKINLLIREASEQSRLEALQLCSNLQKICETSSETVKGSYMLELIALQMQLHATEIDSIDRNFSVLQKLYEKSFEINSLVPHPKVMGIIKEFGGEIYMKQSNYDRASNEFYESFKNYDELGDHLKRISMLKTLVIANMLSESEINPFHSKEFQSFAKLPDIQIFLQLYDSFTNVDIDEFMALVARAQAIESNPFLARYLEELESIIQLKTIIRMTKYYSKLELKFLATVLHCNVERVEKHLLKLVSSGKLINLKIDYIDQVVEIQDAAQLKGFLIENIDVDDITKTLIELSAEEVRDSDGDLLMGDLNEEPISGDGAASNPDAPEVPTLRGKDDYITLNPALVESLGLILGDLSYIASKENQKTIYKVKLQTVLRDWLSILSRAIPVKTVDRLSQFEQVKLEQKQQQINENLVINEEHDNDNDNEDNDKLVGGGNALKIESVDTEVEQETKMGELVLNDVANGANAGGVSVGTDGSLQLSADDAREVQSKKMESLRTLIKSIQGYQEKLVRHYDDRSTFANNLIKQVIRNSQEREYI